MVVVNLSYGQLFFLFAKTFVITLFALCLLKSVSFTLGLVDYPGGRKKHKKIVPMIGGLAIFIGISFSFFPLIVDSQVYFSFWSVCLGVVVLATVDDLYGLSPSNRLFIQFLLTSMMIIFGHTGILHLGNVAGLGDILLGKMSLIFTGVAIVGVANAVNMMDGVDGLTGCVSLGELACLLFLTWHAGAHVETILIVLLMGSIVAFLCFNFPMKPLEKMKIFLGDAGSLFIGFTLAWLCVRVTQNQFLVSYPPVLMLWILALPLMDTLHLMINRKMRGVSPFRGDRRHIHHLLLQLNYSPRETNFILTALSMLIGILGITLYLVGAPEWLLMVAILVLFALYSMFAYRLKKRISRRQYKFSVPFLRTEIQRSGHETHIPLQ